MKATVVVSCYNQENYINECLDSILEQKTDFDFDVIIADDCSTDKTPQLVQNYKEKYADKITILPRPHNLGPAKNYVDAHQHAKGDIVFHIDGDDVMLPGKLQKQFALFRDNPEINVIFHRAQYFSDDERYKANTGSPLNIHNSVLYFNADDLAQWGTVAVHSSYAYRRSSRQFVRGAIDFMEWFFAMDSLLPKGKGAYIDEVLLKYRCNLNGSTYLSTKKGRLKAYKIYLNDLFYYFQKYPQLKQNLYSNALITYAAMLRGKYFWWGAIPFFIKNIHQFRLHKVLGTARMRRAVAPETKLC